MGNDFCNVSKRVKDLDLKTEFGIIDENSQEKDLKILNQEDKLMDNNSKINNEKTKSLEIKLNEYGKIIKKEEMMR